MCSTPSLIIYSPDGAFDICLINDGPLSSFKEDHQLNSILAALSSWMVVAPCLTVNPHQDWSLVTIEPSVNINYEILRSAVFFNEKLDL